jgi:uncharacterized membrane protein
MAENDNYKFQPDESWVYAAPQHIPEFTYWPFIMALGLFFLGWGIVTTWPLFALGIITFIISLGGWIYELRETFYEENEERDES